MICDVIYAIALCCGFMLIAICILYISAIITQISLFKYYKIVLTYLQHFILHYKIYKSQEATKEQYNILTDYYIKRIAKYFDVTFSQNIIFHIIGNISKFNDARLKFYLFKCIIKHIIKKGIENA